MDASRPMEDSGDVKAVANEVIVFYRKSQARSMKKRTKKNE